MEPRDRAVEEMKANADRAQEAAAAWAAEVSAATLRMPSELEKSAYAFGWLIGRQQIIEAMRRGERRGKY